MPYINRLTVEEVKQRVPLILKRITLEGIEAMVVLDHYPMDSFEFERHIMSMQGYMNKLWKMYMTFIKIPKKVELTNKTVYRV